MELTVVDYALSAAAAALAWLAARQRTPHTPVALLLTGGLAADLARRSLRATLLDPMRATMRAQGIDPANVPFSGLARAACDVDNALFLAWPAGLAALSVWTFTRRRPWGVLAVHAAAVVFLVIGYPTFRGALLGRAYLAFELACLCVAVGAMATGLARLPRDERVTLSTVSTGVLIAGHFSAVVFGPYKLGPFSAWNLAQSSYLAIYAALILAHGVWLWRHRRRQP